MSSEHRVIRLLQRMPADDAVGAIIGAYDEPDIRSIIADLLDYCRWLDEGRTVPIARRAT
jgi:hypothetical protein